MRLIDADALPRFGKRGGLVNWCDIVKAQTVDAVPVIMCKDCKHWQKSPTNINKHICYWGSFVKSENDFCSWGKRKEE